MPERRSGGSGLKFSWRGLDEAFQNLTVPSVLALAMCLPSGEKAASTTSAK